MHKLRRNRALSLAMLLVVAISTALMPVAALAAPADNLSTIRVGVHEDPQTGATLVVAGDVPENATLPAEVALPVPTGTEIYWVGEILGGDPSADPTATYTVEKRDGYDLLTFKLTKSRTAQIEAAWPAAFALNGDTKTLKLDWTAAGKTPLVQIGLEAPQGSTPVTSTPGMQPAPQGNGSTMYFLDKPNTKPGDKVAVTISYKGGNVAAPAPTPGQPAGGGDSTGTLVLVLGAAAALLGFMAFNIQRRIGQRGAVKAPPASAPVAVEKKPRAKATKVAEAGGDEDVDGEHDEDEGDDSPANLSADSSANGVSPQLIIVGLGVIGVIAVFMLTVNGAQ